MRAEGALNLKAINNLRSRPSFGRIEDNHWPARAHMVAIVAGVPLDIFYLLNHRIECRRHGFMHQLGIVALDEVGGPSITAKQLFQFLAGDTREDSRIRDFVAVEM